MTIEFDAETIKVVAAGRTAWAKLKRDETWSDWVTVGRAISAGKAAMMRYLRTNSPAGRQWSEYFGGWLRENGFDEIDAGVRNRLDKCMDHLSEIEAWRETIGVDKRQQWNHPNTVWRHFDTKHGISEKAKAATKAKGQDEVVKELQQVADQLHETYSNGALFDLSSPEMMLETCRTFIDVHGNERSLQFFVMGAVLSSHMHGDEDPLRFVSSRTISVVAKPVPDKPVDPTFTESLAKTPRKRRGVKALDDPGRPRNRAQRG